MQLLYKFICLGRSLGFEFRKARELLCSVDPVKMEKERAKQAMGRSQRRPLESSVGLAPMESVLRVPSPGSPSEMSSHGRLPLPTSVYPLGSLLSWQCTHKN